MTTNRSIQERFSAAPIGRVALVGAGTMGRAIGAGIVTADLVPSDATLARVRELGRRMALATRHWPRPLRTKWVAVGLLVLFFWAYESFDLWEPDTGRYYGWADPARLVPLLQEKRLRSSRSAS